MHEAIINLHMHTRYSDGSGLHADIVRAAFDAGIDGVIVTDHNVLVRGPEAVYQEGDRRVVMLVGQEIHDQDRVPQKNHMLVIGAERDLATYADDPQVLINRANESGGLTFLAHPNDPPAPLIGEDDLSWVDWQVQNYTGLEIWNGLSELKPRLGNYIQALYYLTRPHEVARGPFPETLQQWDRLLASGKRIAAVGGSDAHALKVHKGPLKLTVFPYEFHFRAVNTHILTPEPLSGDLANDKKLILNALRRGNSFVGYDLPHSTRGFRFTAQGRQGTVWMGEEIRNDGGITFQIRLPHPAPCRILHNGKELKSWPKRETCTYIGSDAGAYRVEAEIEYKGRSRGWIYSNPIYVKA